MITQYGSANQQIGVEYQNLKLKNVSRIFFILKFQILGDYLNLPFLVNSII